MRLARQHVLRSTLSLRTPRPQTFAFFADATNLERITPPELRFETLTPKPVAIGKGMLIDYRLRPHGVPVSWRALIREWQPPDFFVDEQISGPFAHWVHTHRFRDSATGGTEIEDEVVYALPLYPFGELALPFVKRQLARNFAHRESSLRKLIDGPSRLQPEDVEADLRAIG